MTEDNRELVVQGVQTRNVADVKVPTNGRVKAGTPMTRAVQSVEAATNSTSHFFMRGRDDTEIIAMLLYSLL